MWITYDSLTALNMPIDYTAPFKKRGKSRLFYTSVKPPSKVERRAKRKAAKQSRRRNR